MKQVTRKDVRELKAEMLANAEKIANAIWIGTLDALKEVSHLGDEMKNDPRLLFIREKMTTYFDLPADADALEVCAKLEELSDEERNKLISDTVVEDED